MNGRRTRLLLVLLSMLLLPSVASGHVVPGSSGPGCSTDLLVTCKAERTVDPARRALELDLEVTSPANGFAPGSGTAQRVARLEGAVHLSQPARRVHVFARLRVPQAAASHERPIPSLILPAGPRPLVPSGDGTHAWITARLTARSEGCSPACTAIGTENVVTTGCGHDRAMNDVIGVHLLLKAERGKEIPAGSITYVMALSGTAKLGSSPYMDQQSDSGTAAAHAEVVVAHVNARPARGPLLLPEFCPRQPPWTLYLPPLTD